MVATDGVGRWWRRMGQQMVAADGTADGGGGWDSGWCGRWGGRGDVSDQDERPDT